LHYAIRAKLLDENPATVAPNPEPKRTEIVTFTLDELDLAAAELHPRHRGLPVFAALTGLRSCEWIALERTDVDRRTGVVHVRRTLVDGNVKPLRQDRPVAQDCPAAHQGRPGARRATRPTRHPALVSGRPRRTPRAPRVAVEGLVSGAPRCRHRPACPLRDAAHVREHRDRQRCEPVRAVAVHGHVTADARPHLRADADGLARGGRSGPRRPVWPAAAVPARVGATVVATTIVVRRRMR
jgi:integrase